MNKTKKKSLSLIVDYANSQISKNNPQSVRNDIPTSHYLEMHLVFTQMR